MASSNERFVNVTLDDTLTSYYTVPANKKITIGAITICNRTASTRHVTLLLNGFGLIDAHRDVDPGETVGISLAHTLYATEEIEAGLDSAEDNVDLIISGLLEDV